MIKERRPKQREVYFRAGELVKFNGYLVSNMSIAAVKTFSSKLGAFLGCQQLLSINRPSVCLLKKLMSKKIHFTSFWLLAFSTHEVIKSFPSNRPANEL